MQIRRAVDGTSGAVWCQLRDPQRGRVRGPAATVAARVTGHERAFVAAAAVSSGAG